MFGFAQTTQIGLNCITNCFIDNSRKFLYFSNGISAWLIHLISPSLMYGKINQSPVG